jgi:hypothetical protein
VYRRSKLSAVRFLFTGLSAGLLIIVYSAVLFSGRVLFCASQLIHYLIPVLSAHCTMYGVMWTANPRSFHIEILCSLGTSDFDAQMSGMKFWKGDENLRPVKKNGFTKY